jgi:hypothetical protein
MVQTHQDSCEEGTTTPFPPQETEKIWHGFSDPQKVIQLYHREHPDWLHHCLVQYGKRSASNRKALQRVVRTVQYITGAKLPAIQDLYTPATPVIDCSLCCHSGSGTGVPSLGPKGSLGPTYRYSDTANVSMKG